MADRVRGFWKLGRVGSKMDHLLYTSSFVDVTVDYFMRCPYCEKMMSVQNSVLLSVNGMPYSVEAEDCLVCFDCQRHYFVTLVKMTETVLRILRSRGESC